MVFRAAGGSRQPQRRITLGSSGALSHVHGTFRSAVEPQYPLGVDAPRLDIRRPEVASLLADPRTMSIWEMLRRFGRAVSVAELGRACELPERAITDSLGRLVRVGLAETALVRRGRRGSGFRAVGERIIVEIDPSQSSDSALLASLSSAFEAESRARIERSLVDARAGRDGHGRNHAYAYLALDAAEAKELLSLFAPIDAFVARIANRPPDPDGPAPMPCNYHLALHVAPIADRMLPKARILLARRGVAAETARSRADREPMGRLAAREREVATLLGAGLTTAEVAKRLGIRPSSVVTLTSRIYRKLGIRRRAELAARLKGLSPA